MKEVLSVFTFGIGALCFVGFVTVFKPTAVSAVVGTSKPKYLTSRQLATDRTSFAPVALPTAGKGLVAFRSALASPIPDDSMRCKDCSQVRGYPFKRSHLVALRPTKISAAR
jgi:hypothetical protein